MADLEFQRRLGERLRAIRVQQGLTLQQVEERSGGQWKAVVVGSYERAVRAISVAKLAELAAFYGVPLDELLPDDAKGTGQQARPEASKVVVDLVRLRMVADDPVLEPVARLAANIQSQRGDYNGRVLTLRGEDLQSLAVVVGIEREELLEKLDQRDVLAATG